MVDRHSSYGDRAVREQLIVLSRGYDGVAQRQRRLWDSEHNDACDDFGRRDLCDGKIRKSEAE
jgi:hypothetical protein